MDYTSLPKELIYKERTNLEDFGVDDKPSLNNFIYEHLFNAYYREHDFEGLALRIFNCSYYICTMALAEKRPEIRFGAYLFEASSSYYSVSYKNLVLAIVLLQFWARRWDMPGHRISRLAKLIENELREKDYDNIFKGFFYSITQEMQAAGIYEIKSEDDFVPREINMRVLRDCDYGWYEVFDKDEERVWGFISEIGKNEEEQKTIVAFLRDELYSVFDNELEKKYFFEGLESKIRKRFHGEEDRAREEAEFEAYIEQETLKELQAEWNKDRCEELEKIVAQQKEEIEQLKQKKEKDNCEEVEEKSDDKITDTVEVQKLSKELAEAQKRINELKLENTRLKNANYDLKSDNQELQDGESSKKIKELEDKLERTEKLHEDTLIALMTPTFNGSEKDARDFLEKIKGLDDEGVADVMNQYATAKKVAPKRKKSRTWEILKAAKLYSAEERTWSYHMKKTD